MEENPIKEILQHLFMVPNALKYGWIIIRCKPLQKYLDLLDNFVKNTLILAMLNFYNSI